MNRISFAGYFSTDALTPMKCFSELLPLITENVNSHAVVRHTMDVVTDIIKSVNPEQSIIMTADQPVYALGKQVQWLYKPKYDNVIWMMGGLHIEMVCLDILVGGMWLDSKIQSL